MNILNQNNAKLSAKNAPAGEGQRRFIYAGIK